MNNDLKILYIKQAHDSTGPFQSYGWDDDITPIDVLNQFYGKTYQFETLLYYKCDFVIIQTKQNSPWLQTKLSINGYKEHIEQNVKSVIDLTKINYGKYDVVITHDPILHPYIEELKKIYKDTLFTFIMAEHTSWQMHSFGFEYDLWLDHTLNSVWDISRLPQAINYVFPRTPELVQSMFEGEKESIFIDYRSYSHFTSAGIGELNMNHINDFNKNLKFDNIEIPIELISETSLKPYMFTTNSDDSNEYYKKLNRSKYFVTIANRVGQAACDAASMGCLVIGNSKSKIHNLICHTDCVMDGDFTYKDVLQLIEKIELDSDYYDMLLLNQNKNLQKYGVNYDMDMLKKAVELKRKNNE
jgi:hypothetical protein|tara:strand:+ start:2169 stop:3239 length:1071 start_codon:yes stop_codon:yes gene_type:complete